MLHDLGQTILLTTHYMEEAEALCDRVAVVDHGKVLACGTVDELNPGTGADTVITVRSRAGVPGFADRAGLADLPGVSKVEADGDQVRVFTREPEGVLGELVSAGAANGLHVRDAAQLKPSLETVFLTLTGTAIFGYLGRGPSATGSSTSPWREYHSGPNCCYCWSLTSLVLRAPDDASGGPPPT